MTKVPQHFEAWQPATRVIMPSIRSSEVRIVAISGSQGSGKSTLADILVGELRRAGVPSAAVSLDDFYLTRSARSELAQRVHPLLATRGVPGTHEIAWLQDTLRGVRDGKQEIVVPRFDKGADDRRGEEVLSVDVLVIEGWCLGVLPEPSERLLEPMNTLERDEDADGTWRRYVNDAIAQRYAPTWPLIDLWVHLRVPSFEQVLAWRTKQEQALPPARRMSAPALERFVSHYERCTRWLWASPPVEPGYVVELASDHQVAGVRPLG